jgi:hypothetical protein
VSKSFQDLNLKLCLEREPQMIWLCIFKEHEGIERKSPLGGQWKEKEKVPFHLFPFPPQATLLRPSCFSFNIKVLLYHGSRPLFMHFLIFPWLINYDHAFWCHKSPTHSVLIQFGWKFIYLSLKLWCHVSHILWALSCVNEWRVGPKSFLNLMLTQHPCDEDPKPQKVHAHLEVDPP